MGLRGMAAWVQGSHGAGLWCGGAADGRVDNANARRVVLVASA